MDPRIDRLRGLLAIGVLLGHAIDLAQMSVSNPSGTIFSIAMATRPFFGFVCVVGFIVLSGYCIARSTMRRFSLGEYAVMRVTRVYPLLIVAVLFTALVEWMAIGSASRPEMWAPGREIRKFVAALAGFGGFKGSFGALAPAYTISYELLYYAIWGLAMTAAFGRTRRALMISASIAVALIVSGSWLRASLGWFAGFLPFAGIALLPGWLLGAALALGQDRVIKVARAVPTWAAWLLFAVVYAYFVDTWKAPYFSDAGEYFYVGYFLIISGLYFTIVAASLARPAPGQSAADTWLGEISYPLFLIHGPTIIGLQFAMNLWGIKAPFAVNLAILLAASFVMAMLLLRFVERPVMAWRRRIRQTSSSAAPAPHSAVSAAGAAVTSTP